MYSKICNKCGENKMVTEYHKGKTKDGYQYTCKVCKQNYAIQNKEKENERKLKWKLNNPEKTTESKKKYYQLNREKEIRRNTNKINERKKTDTTLKLSCLMRSRTSTFIKLKKYKKNNNTFKIIGCSPSELKCYIENLFTEGMSWENHGSFGWHIDHIVPLSSANTEEEIYKLCHYSNLQPLWAIENLQKGSKVL